MPVESTRTPCPLCSSHRQCMSSLMNCTRRRCWVRIMNIVKPKIFLSHSKSDSEFVHRMMVDLSKGGVDCRESDSAIRSADAVRRAFSNLGIPEVTLFCSYVTRSYLASSNCMDEL